MPSVDPIRSVAPAAKVKALAPVPDSKPVPVMAKSPLFVKVLVVPPAIIIAVPEIVPVQVEANVKFNLAVPLPMEKVSVAATEKVVEIVMVLPLAVGWKVTVPPMARLLSVIVGTFVIAPDLSVLIMTSPPATGTPFDQLPAVAQDPPVIGCQVVVCAKVFWATTKRIEAKRNLMEIVANFCRKLLKVVEVKIYLSNANYIKSQFQK